MPVIPFYALMILDITGYILPVWVAQAAIRRARASFGFNRWLYGYAALVALVSLGFLLATPRTPLLLYLLAEAGAWATLPLWTVIRLTAHQTRAERPAPALPAREPLPVPPLRASRRIRVTLPREAA